MTGRTHDLAAFTLLSYAFVTFMPESLSLGTIITSMGSNILGGLYPDLDQAGSDFWKRFRGGKLIGKIIAPILGGHRMISHSIVGFIITGFFLDKLLQFIFTFLLVDMTIVWIAFMIGYVSHIVTDMVTKEGVPLFFPISWSIGIPPFRFMRITTGAKFEKFIVYPGLLFATGYLYMNHYHDVLSFFQHNIH